jgi:hypothetical protein
VSGGVVNRRRVLAAMSGLGLLRRRVLAAVSRLSGLGGIGIDGNGLKVGGVSLSHGADCSRDSNSLGGDMGLLGAVSDLRRALGDGVDTGGVDG